MSSDEGLPETAGMRVRVVPGVALVFSQLNIKRITPGASFEEHCVRFFVDSSVRNILWCADRLCGVMVSFTFTKPNARKLRCGTRSRHRFYGQATCHCKEQAPAVLKRRGAFF